MAGACAAPDPDLGLVRGLLGSVDCNVQALAQSGYAAIAGPGSPVSEALTVLLTIYIAVMGLRLMLGMGTVRVGELTMTALKIGIVVVLATSWPVYQQLVFDTLVRGPEQLGGAVLRGLSQADGSQTANPYIGLQSAYDSLQRAAQFYGQHAPTGSSPLQGGPGFAAMSLTLSAMLLLLNTVGPLLAAKIVLALLLALGPVFVAMLLFDATRGLFEGWVRAAAGFAFVPLLAMLGLVMQLTILRPQIDQLTDLQGQNLLNPGVANGIFLLSLIFSMVTLALLIAVGVLAAGFRLPRARSAAAAQATSAYGVPASGAAAALQPQALAIASPAPERAARLAMAAAAIERRDAREAGGGDFRVQLAGAGASGLPRQSPASARPSGPSQRRSAQPRRAASSQRRDR